MFIYYYMYSKTHDINDLLGLFYAKVKKGETNKLVSFSGLYGYSDSVDSFDPYKALSDGKVEKITKEVLDDSISITKDSIYKTIDGIIRMKFKAEPKKLCQQKCPFGDICNVYNIAEIDEEEQE